MQHKYDTIVSLGWNCEVSFRIEDYLNHKIDSYLYSWTGIQNQDKFIQSLYHIDDILQHEITLLSWGMFRCEKYQIDFHGTFPVTELFDENHQPVPENVAIAKKDLKSRICYLGTKFQKLLNSEKTTLFVIKPLVEMQVEKSNMDYVRNVYKFLKEKYRSGKFMLLVVVEKKYEDVWKKELNGIEDERCKLGVVNYFPHKDKVKDSGDIKNWMKLFLEVDDMETGFARCVDYCRIQFQWLWKRKGWKIYNHLECKLVKIYHWMKKGLVKV